VRIFGPEKAYNTNYITEKINRKNNNQKESIEVNLSKDYEIRKNAVDKLRKIDELEKQAKIDRLKKEIKAGEYNIDPKELAEIIIDIAM